MSFLSEERKTFWILFPRSEYFTSDAMVEASMVLTMSRKWGEASENILDSRPDPFSLEVYVENGEIAFGFTASGHNIAAILGIIYQIYPEAEVIEVPEYFEDVSEGSHVAVANMTYKRSNLFGVKTYRVIEADPMHPFLNVLVELPKHVRLLFQMTSRTHYSVKGTYYGLEIATWIHWFRSRFSPRYWVKREVREREAQGIHEKIRGNLMWSNIHIGCVIDGSETKGNPSAIREEQKRYIQSVVGSWSILKDVHWNWFVMTHLKYGYDQLERLRKRTVGKRRPNMQIAMAEQAALWHLPGVNEALHFKTVKSRKWGPPPDLPSPLDSGEVTPVGETNWRGIRQDFGIFREDRKRHLLLAGGAGVGKTPVLKRLIQNDIEKGFGCALLVPDAALFEDVLNIVPDSRVEDVVIIDPTDIDYPASLNPLDYVPSPTRMQVASEIIDIFRRRFPRSWSVPVENVLMHLVVTLLGTKFTTILSMKRLLVDEAYRASIVSQVEDLHVKAFWNGTFPEIVRESYEQVVAPIVQMVEDFTAHDMIYHTLGQPFNAFDFREIVDEQKILLMKIPGRDLGEANASVLGGMLLSRIFQAAMSRIDVSIVGRKDFYLYIDEFDQFATTSFAEILSESRKYGLNLTLATQTLGALPESVRYSLFTNVVNVFAFATSTEDSSLLEPEFQPNVKQEDLSSQAPEEFYVKTSVYGISQPIFSARLSPKTSEVKADGAKAALAHSREKYCVPRAKAGEIIKQWGAVG